MLDALGQAGDREAALVHFAHSVSTPEARILREALDGDGTNEDEDGDGERRP